MIFDEAMNRYLEMNFSESEAYTTNEGVHKVSYKFIIESLIFEGKVNEIQTAIDNEEVGVDKNNEEIKKLLIILNSGYK